MLLHKMKQRMDALQYRMDRDFSGSVQSDLYAFNELKFWKELIERGEADVRIWGDDE